jgi:putative membrane protein
MLFSGGGFMWLIWVLIIVLIVFGIKWMLGAKAVTMLSNNVNDSSPLDTLKQRYAKGEISEEEFLRQCKILKEN